MAEYHLAAGVSNAGGLGIIGAASAPADWVREQVREAKKLTDKPFGRSFRWLLLSHLRREWNAAVQMQS